MSDLRELYQEVILDHGRHPRNFGRLAHSTHQQEGFNPLCGDKLTLFIEANDETIRDIKFEGCGCAISMASASLMTEALQGKSISEAKQLFDDFHELLTGDIDSDRRANLGKLTILDGVSEYPMRVKCATLAWHTAKAALDSKKQASVSTE